MRSRSRIARSSEKPPKMVGGVVCQADVHDSVRKRRHVLMNLEKKTKKASPEVKSGMD